MTATTTAAAAAAVLPNKSFTWSKSNGSPLAATRIHLLPRGKEKHVFWRQQPFTAAWWRTHITYTAAVAGWKQPDMVHTRHYYQGRWRGMLGACVVIPAKYYTLPSHSFTLIKGTMAHNCLQLSDSLCCCYGAIWRACLIICEAKKSCIRQLSSR